MHAIIQHDFGQPEELRYEEAPDPVPAEGQVRIAVEAAGVHFIDTMIRRGGDGPFPRPDLPMIPGREVAGTVEAVGPTVDRGWVGRRVVAHLGMASRGYAEKSVANVEALHGIPSGLDAGAAVAMIGTGRTAIGILEVAALTADDVVLIPAAAGGLGALFVQAARNAGAVAVGLAGGAAKVERVRSLSADVAVDYLQPDWPERVRGALDGRDVSVVLDGVGGEPGRAAFDLLGVGGRHIIFGWSAGEPTALTTQDLMEKGTTAMAIGPRLVRRPGGLRPLEAQALEEAASGRWRPLLTCFPLAEAAEAHRALEQRQTVGKVVLVP
jgi:NADPH2:quinone reductase